MYLLCEKARKEFLEHEIIEQFKKHIDTDATANRVISEYINSIVILRNAEKDHKRADADKKSSDENIDAPDVVKEANDKVFAASLISLNSAKTKSEEAYGAIEKKAKKLNINITDLNTAIEKFELALQRQNVHEIKIAVAELSQKIAARSCLNIETMASFGNYLFSLRSELTEHTEINLFDSVVLPIFRRDGLLSHKFFNDEEDPFRIEDFEQSIQHMKKDIFIDWMAGLSDLHTSFADDTDKVGFIEFLIKKINEIRKPLPNTVFPSNVKSLEDYVGHCRIEWKNENPEKTTSIFTQFFFKNSKDEAFRTQLDKFAKVGVPAIYLDQRVKYPSQ